MNLTDLFHSIGRLQLSEKILMEPLHFPIKVLIVYQDENGNPLEERVSSAHFSPLTGRFYICGDGNPEPYEGGEADKCG